MRLKNNYFLYAIILLGLLLSFSCNNDDDNGGGDGQVTYASTCCQVPHLEACVEGAKVFVPNAFTPNGDGFNDLFYPNGGSGIKEISSFKVFGEAGTIVHEVSNFLPNDPSLGWDGSSPDGLIEDGIFTYTIVIDNINEVSMSFDGSVCLRVGESNSFSCVDLENHCVYSTHHDGNGGFNPSLPNFEICE